MDVEWLWVCLYDTVRTADEKEMHGYNYTGLGNYFSHTTQILAIMR